MIACYGAKPRWPLPNLMIDPATTQPRLRALPKVHTLLETDAVRTLHVDWPRASVLAEMDARQPKVEMSHIGG